MKIKLSILLIFGLLCPDHPIFGAGVMALPVGQQNVTFADVFPSIYPDAYDLFNGSQGYSCSFRTDRYPFYDNDCLSILAKPGNEQNETSTKQLNRTEIALMDNGNIEDIKKLFLSRNITLTKNQTRYIGYFIDRREREKTAKDWESFNQAKKNVETLITFVLTQADDPVSGGAPMTIDDADQILPAAKTLFQSKNRTLTTNQIKVINYYVGAIKSYQERFTHEEQLLEKFLMGLNSEGNDAFFPPFYIRALMKMPGTQQAKKIDHYASALDLLDSVDINTERKYLLNNYNYYKLPESQIAALKFDLERKITRYASGEDTSEKDLLAWSKNQGGFFGSNLMDIATDYAQPFIETLKTHPKKTLGINLGVGALALSRYAPSWKKQALLQSGKDEPISPGQLIGKLINTVIGGLYKRIIETKGMENFEHNEETFISGFSRLNSVQDRAFKDMFPMFEVLGTASVRLSDQEISSGLLVEIPDSMLRDSEKVLARIKIYQGRFDMDKLDDKNVDTTGLSDEDHTMLTQYHKLIDQDIMFAHDDKRMLKNIAAMAMDDMSKALLFDGFADDEKLLTLEVLEKKVLNGTSSQARSQGILRPVRLDD